MTQPPNTFQDTFQDTFDIPGQTYFENTQHELILFESERYREANLFLLSELPEDEVRANIAPDHPSWQWQVIGHFGTKGESVILEPQTGKLYIFDWNRYPINQDFLAWNIPDLLRRLQDLDADQSIWDIL